MSKIKQISSSRESCTCSQCVSCCEFYPGWFTPEEAQKAIDAGHGDKLMVDWFTDYSKDSCPDIEALIPASVGYAGGYAPDAPSGFMAMFSGWSGPGRCVFLKNRRCSLHKTDFKPLECRSSLSCKDSDEEMLNNPRKQNIYKLWDTPEGRALVKKWKEERGLSETRLSDSEGDWEDEDESFDNAS